MTLLLLIIKSSLVQRYIAKEKKHVDLQYVGINDQN